MVSFEAREAWSETCFEGSNPHKWAAKVFRYNLYTKSVLRKNEKLTMNR